MFIEIYPAYRATSYAFLTVNSIRWNATTDFWWRGWRIRFTEFNSWLRSNNIHRVNWHRWREERLFREHSRIVEGRGGREVFKGHRCNVTSTLYLIHMTVVLGGVGRQKCCLAFGFIMLQIIWTCVGFTDNSRTYSVHSWLMTSVHGGHC